MTRCEVTTDGRRCPRWGLRFVVVGQLLCGIAAVCKAHRAALRAQGYTLDRIPEFATADGRKKDEAKAEISSNSGKQRKNSSLLPSNSASKNLEFHRDRPQQFLTNLDAQPAATRVINGQEKKP